VFLKENNRVTRIEGEVMATTKERLERLINAKKQLEAQISRNGQILAAVSKVAHSSWYPVLGMGYIYLGKQVVVLHTLYLLFYMIRRNEALRYPFFWLWYIHFGEQLVLKHS